MDNTIFELKDVRFSYLGKFPALCGVDLNICAKEKIAVLGANGSGKSTLLHLLDGLILPDSGLIKFFGRQLTPGMLNEAAFAKYFRANVGLVFQNPDVQLFCPTVKEDIVFGPLQLGVKPQELNNRLEKIVDTFKIGDLLDRAPHQLSIGEKRKVAIASTLIIEPQVIILDEPTSGLDPQTTRQIIDIVIQANLEGKTIITATHDLHIVEEISDIVYIMSQKKKIAKFGCTYEVLGDIDTLKENNLIHIHSHRHKDTMHTHTHDHIEHHHGEGE